MPITTGNEIPLTDDIISNFGKFLPAPYIERVEVHLDKITVVVSLFLLTDLYEDTDSMINYLSEKLNFYVMHAWARQISGIDFFGGDDADWDLVIDGKMNIFDAYNEATLNTTITEYGLMDLEPIDSLKTPSVWKMVEDLYDDNGNKIIKFQTSIDYEWLVYAAKTGTDPWNPTTPSYVVDFWNIFAFASLYEHNADDIEETLENIALLDREVSDISYERLFKDGELQHKIVSFVDADDLVYGDIPIQSITGPYYKTDNITRDDMVEYFEDFVTGFKEADTYDPDDDALNTMLDSISLVVEEYSESTQFLKEMDLRRAHFTSKDPAEPVGKLYTRFRKRIYTANRALENGTQVKKVLNRNPKIIDMRFDEILSYTPGSAAADDADTYIYSESLVSRAGFYYLGGAPGEITPEYVRNRGYFFFDYEKALRQTAVINEVFDVGRLTSLGINVIPYDAFEITNAEIIRTENEDTDPIDIKISCTFSTDYNYPLTDTATVDNSAGGYDLYCTPSPSATDDTSTLPSDETSYLVLRNFVPNQTDSISSGIPDYRLSCFEYQDFYDADFAIDSPTNAYSVSVTVTDKTIEVAAGLVSYYESVQEFLATYYDSAADELSYNTFGEFNTFFSDGITSAYTSAEEAPWNVVPVIYCIYQDLVYGFYDGDMDKITDAAQKIMDGIDPYAGNFFILDTFKTAFDNFYTDALSPASPIGIQITTHRSSATLYTYSNTEHTYEGEVLWDSSSSETGEDSILWLDESGDEPVDLDDVSGWDVSEEEMRYDISSGFTLESSWVKSGYTYTEIPADYVEFYDQLISSGDHWPDYEDSAHDDYTIAESLNEDLLEIFGGTADGTIAVNAYTSPYLDSDGSTYYKYYIRVDPDAGYIYVDVYSTSAS